MHRLVQIGGNATGVVEQHVKQILASDNSDHLLTFNHRKQPLLAVHDVLLNFDQRRIRGDTTKFGAHKITNVHFFETVIYPLVNHLAREYTHQTLPVYHRCGIDVVTREQISGLMQIPLRRYRYDRRGHQVSSLTSRTNPTLENPEKLLLDLDHGKIFDGGRSSTGMTTPSKNCRNLSYIHFMQAAARYQVNPVFHPGKGK